MKPLTFSSHQVIYIYARQRNFYVNETLQVLFTQCPLFLNMKIKPTLLLVPRQW